MFKVLNKFLMKLLLRSLNKSEIQTISDYQCKLIVENNLFEYKNVKPMFGQICRLGLMKLSSYFILKDKAVNSLESSLRKKSKSHFIICSGSCFVHWRNHWNGAKQGWRPCAPTPCHGEQDQGHVHHA